MSSIDSMQLYQFLFPQLHTQSKIISKKKKKKTQMFTVILTNNNQVHFSYYTHH